jgi:hypothetical protein
VSAIPLNRHEQEDVAVLDGEVRIIDIMESVQNLYRALDSCADSEEVNEGPWSEGDRDKKRPPLAQGPSDHGRKPMAGYLHTVPPQRSEQQGG